MAAARAIARASRLTSLVGAAPRLARAFAKKVDKAETGAMSHAEITKIFLDMDAAAPAAATSELGVKLTGRSGALVEGLYAATVKSKGAFDASVKQLEGFVNAVRGAGLVVDRFFTTSNYSPEECKLVVDLLITSKEPLTSFDGIKNADVRELIVDNEGNLETWRAARKAVAALNLSEDVKGVLEALAGDARLDLVKRVAEKAADLRLVTSKAADAIVTSAVALTKDQQAAISKALPAYAPSGTSLNVHYSVDPAVLGGLQITVKNTTIDLSATSRLVDVVAASRAAGAPLA